MEQNRRKGMAVRVRPFLDIDALIDADTSSSAPLVPCNFSLSSSREKTNRFGGTLF